MPELFIFLFLLSTDTQIVKIYERVGVSQSVYLASKISIVGAPDNPSVSYIRCPNKLILWWANLKGTQCWRYSQHTIPMQRTPQKRGESPPRTALLRWHTVTGWPERRRTSMNRSARVSLRGPWNRIIRTAGNSSATNTSDYALCCVLQRHRNVRCHRRGYVKKVPHRCERV